MPRVDVTAMDVDNDNMTMSEMTMSDNKYLLLLATFAVGLSQLDLQIHWDLIIIVEYRRQFKGILHNVMTA